MKTLKLVALLLGALLIPSGVQNSRAVTYFVSPDGNNVNAGTESAPFSTIQKATDGAKPGDVIMVQPGIYPERVKTKNNGAQGSPITFKANGGVTNYGFYVRNSFYTFDGFNVTATTNIPNFEGAFEIVRNLDTINLINNKIHDFDALKTKISGINFQYASNALMCTRNVIVTNNLFQNTSYMMLGLFCSNALVANNVFNFANTHDAMHAFGAEILICDNLFTNISENPSVADHTDIIQTFGDDPSEAYNLVFERNLVINCHAQVCQLEQKGRPNIRNWTFRNNVYANLLMGGNCDIENIKWHNNTFFRCTQTTAGPILLNCNVKGCSVNAEVYNNIFFECGTRPDSVQMGWYHPENTNFVFSADNNFICGLNGASKAKVTEAHGINGGNPGFVDPANFDFRLRPDSVLIGRGRVLNSFSGDKSNLARDSSSWDIGAFAFKLKPRAPSGLRVVQ